MNINKLKLVFLFVSILYVNFSSTIFAEDFDELAVGFSIEAHCSVNAEINKQCFKLDENQCRDIFTKIFAVCRQGPNGLPLSMNDPDDQAVFTDCVDREFLSSLVSRGIDLDAPCGQ